jgi:cytochrome c5
LKRYSRGHQHNSCQGCHESIHGLYPVTPNIDTTSYKQAAALNADGSHGPLKCETCHVVDAQGIPSFMNTNRTVYSVPGYGGAGIQDFDEAVAWAHIYTEEQSVLDTTCQNCHGVQGANWADVNINNSTYMQHASRGNPRGSRQMMDKAEMEVNGGSVFMNAGTNPTQDNGSGGICTACHGNEGANVSCTDGQWLNHLTLGRVSAPVFEKVSVFRTGGTCW